MQDKLRDFNQCKYNIYFYNHIGEENEKYKICSEREC